MHLLRKQLYKLVYYKFIKLIFGGFGVSRQSSV